MICFQECGVLVFLWNSDSDSRVIKFRTLDSDPRLQDLLCDIMIVYLNMT